MEQKNNILQDIIDKAYRNSQPKKLAEIIKPIYNRVNLRDLQITEQDLEKLNRLEVKAEGLEVSFLFGLVYNTIFSSRLIQIESLNPDVVLSIVNILLGVYDKITGTILARRLGIHIKNILFSLIKKPELRNEDKDEIFELLKMPSIRRDNIYAVFETLKEVKEMRDLLKSQQINDKVNGAMKLINIFSMCSEIEEQLEVFTKKLPQLLKITLTNSNENSKDFLELIGYIAECMLFQTRFLLRIDTSVYETHDRRDQLDPLLLTVEIEHPSLDERDDKTQEIVASETVVPYRLLEHELVLKSSENLFPTVSIIIDAFLKVPQIIEIQKVCLHLLQRLFYNFPKVRKSIESSIVAVLSNINNDPSDINKREASAFLYKLVHKDASPEFQALLINHEQLKSLYINPFYDNSVLSNKDNTLESLNLVSLQIQAGFPNGCVIPAGKSFTTHIEAWKPLSVLYWNFLLTDYDIGFTLTRIASFDQLSRDIGGQNVVIYKKERVEASKYPCRGTLLITEPGIFKLEFDNSHSWFNAKELKYDIYVLEPEIGMSESVITEKVTEVLEGENKARRKTTDKASQIKKEEKKDVNKVIDPSTIETTAILNINQTGIEYTVKTKDESYETSINYKNGQVQWDRVNEKILDTTKQAVKIGDDSLENKVLMKIIYDEKALKILYDNNTNQDPVEQITSTLTCLDILKENIFFPLTIVNKIELVIERLLKSLHLESQENIYVICIDNFAKRFYSTYKGGKSVNHKGFDLNNLCLIDMDASENKVGELKKISELYYGTEIPKKRTTYLATLLINAFLLQNSEVSKFLIFENENSFIALEENQQTLKDIFSEYLKKSWNKGKAEEDKPKESEEQENVEVDERKLPEINFYDLHL